MTHSTYQSPFETRYASPEMLRIFSADKRYLTWRKLWIALAKAESELGLPVREDQIEELERHLSPIDYEAVAEYERETRHEVMAHIRAYGDSCPKARSIIHLGATSCYVMDNGELLQLREALVYIKQKLQLLLSHMSDFAERYRNLACLGFTHFQPAQLTTVGKRSCLWAQDFLMDLEDLELRLKGLRFLGVKGATGTQASFLALFNGDHNKVVQLDKRVGELMGFDGLLTIAGQTYTRKQDAQVLDVLAGFATSAHKCATDIRLLSHLREVEEPWGSKQIGSSAMAYKRNPMRSERVCAIARFLISLSENPKYTAATQWLERTLDDSANRRLCLSEACLAADSILNLLIAVFDGAVVNPKVIEKHLKEELPFLATENLLMAAVKKGGDRQELHECLRQHSLDVVREIKEEGKDNHLLTRLAKDPDFPLNEEELEQALSTEDFVGCAPHQVTAFLNNELKPALARQEPAEVEAVELHV